MALYDFACPEHGRFEALRPIEQAASEMETEGDLLPEPCPTCAVASPAVFSAQGVTVRIPHWWGKDRIRKEDVW